MGLKNEIPSPRSNGNFNLNIYLGWGAALVGGAGVTESKNGLVMQIKNKATQIKKMHPHVGIRVIKHDLANYLGFKNWGEMLDAEAELLRKRISENPIKRILK